MPLKHFKSIRYTAGGPRPPFRRPKGRSWRLPSISWGWLPQVLALGAVAAGAGALILVLAFVWYSRNLPDPSNLTRRATLGSTKFYDRTGKTVLYEIAGDQKRTPIAFEDIPAHLKNATLVAEDRDFYSHRGFDLRGIARAILTNIFSDQQVGGSTITQQLVKNTIVGGEKTYSRKIKEVILSYRIEQQFTKDDILELYLNAIPYGGNAYGIEAAAEKYFNKRAKDLTLAEAAVLASLPKSPTSLSPYGPNKDRLIDRQQYILNDMERLGYASKEDVESAKGATLAFVPLRESIQAPHFVFYVRERLSETYGESVVDTGGLSIVTTLDLYKQKIAEEEVLAGATKNEEKYGGKNAALVALDPKTGQILSMVGSRDYFDETTDGNVNVALRPRQPGSSMKPIVYAAAFAKGFTPDAIIYDVLTTFKTDTKDYQPNNYDGKERGPVTVRQALAGSLNIPAVKLLYLTGIEGAIELAEKMGYTTLSDRSRYGLSLVLGGGEVKLLEHVAAYQALAREGVYHEPTAILRVEDATGKVLESYHDRPVQVLSGNVARMVTSILSDNAARAYVFGSDSPLQLGSRPVAAKTGTTNDWRDGWTLGYTPSLVVGVWVGNNDGSAMARGADGSLVAAPIWNGFLKRVLGDTPSESFRAPDDVPITNPALQGKIPATTTVVIDTVSGKRATEFTPPEYREERTYPEVHSELHYIDRANPSGPPPTDPSTDPNYATWEEAVQRWAAAAGKENPTIAAPSDYDDVHTLENQPTLLVTAPIANDTIRGGSVEVTAVASAKRGVASIRFFFDGALLGEHTVSGTYRFPIPAGVAAGFHLLRVEVRDDVGNKKVTERTINYIP